MFLVWLLWSVLLVTVVNCQLGFNNGGKPLVNNSYIYYANISDGDNVLKCVTDSLNCCNDSYDVNWNDETGTVVHEGPDDTSCLYVTREYQEISLNRKSNCIPDTSGLWRCDIADSNDEIQSIYIYISNDKKSGILHLESPHFILHTEPSVSPPEFSIICRTHGGPATIVKWFLAAEPQIEEHIESQQLILNTSRNSTYENRLLVRGRYNGTWTCTVINSYIRDYFPRARNLVQQSFRVTVAGEPTNLTAESNSTHVTVSWKSPGNPVTGYVIYYQSEGGSKSSDIVYGGETESHSLDCLESGVIYYISIVALSLHLPSRLVAVNFSSCNVISITSTPPISTKAITSIITNIATTSISTTMMNTTITAAVKTSLIVTTTHNVTFSSPTSTVSLSSMTSISSSIEYYSSQITTTSTTNTTTNTETTMSHTTLHASTTSIRDTSLITSYHKQPFVSPNQIPYPKNETSTTSTIVAGVIGGVMGLIIICQSVVIAILLTRVQKRKSLCCQDKVKTSDNAAYGVVPLRREYPEYEVIRL